MTAITAGYRPCGICCAEPGSADTDLLRAMPQ
jgi:hypothetical protein